MRWLTISRAWRSRLFVGAAIGGVGYAFAVVLRFDPQPVAYLVMMAVVLTLGWLVLDTVDAPPAEWVPEMRPPTDRVDEATSDLRILTSHVQTSTPTSAVRDRLVALARARDPALAENLQHEIDPARRLSPAEIDRILTRIEEARDRS